MIENFFIGFVCSLCGKFFKQNEVQYLCTSCSNDYKPGIPLKGVLLADFDYDGIKKKFYCGNPDIDFFSAIEQKYFPEFPVGNTPFFKASLLGNLIGVNNLWIKNDALNPTGSLKDRASFAVVADANRIDERIIVTASTGNAASALAAICAAAGKKAVIFVPKSAPRAKLLQIKLFGADLIEVNGTYDDAFRHSLEFTDKHRSLNRNTAYHPMTIEGKKTAGLEIFMQNNFKPPDVIFVPTGDGVIIAGIFKSFHDLKMAKLINSLPKLICVQADTSNAIHNYIESGKYANAENPVTFADSISVSVPSNAHLARRAVLESKGFSITVTDEEIKKARLQLARQAGIFAEPAAAASLAGLLKSRKNNLIDDNQQVVLLITGNGLKDIDSI